METTVRLRYKKETPLFVAYLWGMETKKIFEEFSGIGPGL